MPEIKKEEAPAYSLPRVRCFRRGEDYPSSSAVLILRREREIPSSAIWKSSFAYPVRNVTSPPDQKRIRNPRVACRMPVRQHPVSQRPDRRLPSVSSIFFVFHYSLDSPAVANDCWRTDGRSIVLSAAPPIRSWLHDLPNPAARSVDSSGPRPAQQSANSPSTATAGTERIPNPRARPATSGSFMSSTFTSQEGQATRLTKAMVSSHAGQPALNTSIFRFALISSPPFGHCCRSCFLAMAALLKHKRDTRFEDVFLAAICSRWSPPPAGQSPDT